MTRLLVDSQFLEKSQIQLDKNLSHKLSQVLKLRKGEKVFLIDGCGAEVETEIVSSTKDKTILKAINKKKIIKPRCSITLVQAIAKGDRFDLVLQKATELGVTRIIPIVTKRTVTKIPKEKVENKLRRWQEIIRHAIEQSGQSWLPKINPPIMFEEYIGFLVYNRSQATPTPLIPSERSESGELKLLFYEEEKELGLREVWPKELPKNIIALIGPEGGFDPEEVKLAKKAGFISLTLGKTILRTDTAPIVVLAIIQFLLGETA